jgi:hypothetical protein
VCLGLGFTVGALLLVWLLDSGAGVAVLDVGAHGVGGAVEGDALCVAGGGAAVSGEFGVRGVVDQAGGSHGAGVVGV